MDNKSKIKLFIENFVVYGMGGAISSAIPVIMIPVITRLMPNSSYIGISDMATAIISIGNAFALMGMKKRFSCLYLCIDGFCWSN